MLKQRNKIFIMTILKFLKLYFYKLSGPFKLPFHGLSRSNSTYVKQINLTIRLGVCYSSWLTSALTMWQQKSEACSAQKDYFNSECHWHGFQSRMIHRNGLYLTNLLHIPKVFYFMLWSSEISSSTEPMFLCQINWLESSKLRLEFAL